MADIEIHPDLVDLQRRADSALDAIGKYQQQVGKPALDWTDDERARLTELWDATTEAAGALRDAIDDAGIETEHGSYEAMRALKTAARGNA